MKLYKFETTWKEKGFYVEEIEVEEKPKTYILPKHFIETRLKKDEIGKLTGCLKNRMYCLENNPKIFIKAMIDRRNNNISSLEKELNNEKTMLEKWEKALKDCEVSENGRVNELGRVNGEQGK